jgi:hypothetical protein
VEGPLTNLKPSMIALGQPKRKFDQAAFGVGGVGAGAMGAIGRYHPPEHVGDPIPGSNAAGGPAAVAAGGKSTGLVHGSGALPYAAAAAAGGDGLTDAWPAYSPFAGPSYIIPAVDGSKPSRLGNELAARHGTSSSSSQLAPFTQPIDSPDAKNNFLGFSSVDSFMTQGGIASQGTLHPAAGSSNGSQLFGQAPGRMPSLSGLAGFSSDAPLSQNSLGFLPGAGVAGLLSQPGTGLSQAGTDFLGFDSQA